MQNAAGAPIPPQYECWFDGIHVIADKDVAIGLGTPDHKIPCPDAAGRKRLSMRAIWVAAVGKTVDTDAPLVELAFVTVDGHIMSRWVDREDITDSRRLTALGAVGLPINAGNQKALCQYLAECEALVGLQLPMVRVGSRTGPYLLGTHHGFLLGSRWISSSAPQGLAPDPRDNARFVEGLAAAGDPVKWIDQWRILHAKSWVTRWLIASTFAAPLMRHCKVRTFFVHHWGDSSSGKTAIATFALSAWGNPALLASTLNRTAISITEVFKHMTDLPVLFDEKQVATVESDELIYAVCTGQGRERATRNGGLRDDRATWITLCRTTGEVPLVGADDVGGQSNRVVQVSATAFADKAEAERIYPFTAECHGHAGPFFIAKLMAGLAAAGPAYFQGQYQRLRADIAAKAGADGNHVAYCAVIALAQVLSDVWMLGEDANTARNRAIDDALLALAENKPTRSLPYAERALDLLRDHYVANPASYLDESSSSEDKTKSYRIVGLSVSNMMVLVPSEADTILRNANLDPGRVWRDFAANGWLVNSDAESHKTRVTLRNAQFGHRQSPDHPCYVIKRDVFQSDRRSRLRAVEGGKSSPTTTTGTAQLGLVPTATPAAQGALGLASDLGAALRSFNAARAPAPPPLRMALAVPPEPDDDDEGFTPVITYGSDSP